MFKVFNILLLPNWLFEVNPSFKPIYSLFRDFWHIYHLFQKIKDKLFIIECFLFFPLPFFPEQPVPSTLQPSDLSYKGSFLSIKL